MSMAPLGLETSSDGGRLGPEVNQIFLVVMAVLVVVALAVATRDPRRCGTRLMNRLTAFRGTPERAGRQLQS